jgi:hypothetical protein
MRSRVGLLLLPETLLTFFFGWFLYWVGQKKVESKKVKKVD